MSIFETPRGSAGRRFVRPRCIACGAPMLLARVDPGEPDEDSRIFECSRCARFETVVVKFNASA